MSITFNYSSLTDIQKSKIDLLKRKKKSDYSGKRYRRSKKEIIHLYVKDGDRISLPYYFSRELFNLNPQKLEERFFLQRDITFNGELYDYQMSVFNECLNHLNKSGSVALNVETSFGKTVIACCLMSKIQSLTVVLRKGAIIEQQWLKAIKKFTNAKVKVLNTETLSKLQTKEAPDIIIVSLDMTKHIKSLAYHDNIGFLIVDEVHEFCNVSGIKAVLSIDAGKILACSATMKRKDGMEVFIKTLCGNSNIVKRKVKKKVKVIKLITDMRFTGEWSEYLEQVSFNRERNDLIADFVSLNQEEKIIIMSWRKDHIKQIKQTLKSKDIKCSTLMGIKKECKESRVLVATIQKASTGFDESNLYSKFSGERATMILIVTSTKSRLVFEQMIGRVKRADILPIVIYFVDDYSPCRTHWKSCQKVIKKYQKENISISKDDCYKQIRKII